jgi:DNA polymerase-3 subunit delta
MPSALHAFDYLAAPAKHPAPPVCVAFGDEPFLRRLVVAALQDEVLGAGDADFSLVRFDGASAAWRSVSDELATMAMFGGGRRLVVVDDADEFVSEHRSALEDYVAQPRKASVLVLCPKTWAANTRLYKAVDQSGLQIECKAPSEGKIVKFLVDRAKKVYRATLPAAAAEMLVEMVGPELGLLDQQLATLALLVPPGEPITTELVDRHVGSFRAKTAWDMLDAAALGNAAAALGQLERLLSTGEHPIAILGQVSATLRRFAAATRIVLQTERQGRRPNLREALEQAGFKSFTLNKAENQLKQIGRQRASHLYQWLLEADMALKGSSSAAARARLVLEQLIVRLSTKSAAAAVR